MSEEFKPGDVVQLKSGGPAMTIVRKQGDTWSCVWYAGTGEGYSTAFFVPESLQKKS